MDRATIDVLVLAGVQWELISDLPDAKAGWGRMLWSENLASISYCYPEATDDNRPGPGDFRAADAAEYTLRGPVMELDGAVVLGVLECYEYQSCEHPGWRSSAAHYYCRDLETTLRAAGFTEADEGGWDLDDLLDAAVPDAW